MMVLHPHVERARERDTVVLAAITAAAKAGKACPSIRQLAEIAGVGLKATYSSIRRLANSGEIAVLRRGSPWVVLVHGCNKQTTDVAEERIFQIAEVVAQVANLPASEILGRSRLPLYLRPRFLVYHFARRRGFGAGRIGRVVGRDHSSILHGLRTVEDRRKYDPLFERLYRRVEAALDGVDLTTIRYAPVRLAAPAPAQRQRFEIGEDGELEPVLARRERAFDPLLAALRVAYPERFAA